MNGKVVMLLVAVAVLLVTLLAVVFSQALYVSDISPEPVLTPSLTPTATPATTQTFTATPKPSPTPTPDPAAEGSFGPKGYFRITSPTRNGVYDGGNVTLVIGGEAANLPLFMFYSLDGQEKVTFSSVIKQAHEWDKFFGVISASELLPPLPRGTHTITVYGTLSDTSAQATLHFTIR